VLFRTERECGRKCAQLAVLLIIVGSNSVTLFGKICLKAAIKQADPMVVLLLISSVAEVIMLPLVMGKQGLK